MKRKSSKPTGKKRVARRRKHPGAGRGGVVPPPEHQFKPGKSGNPAGRPPAAGATVVEWENQLAADNLNERDLRAIARSWREPWARRLAAQRLLVSIEFPDMADFHELASGAKTLPQLRDAGVNTEAIKKIKHRTRTLKQDEQDVTEVEVELELHNRGGEESDRILDRTIGKPRQSVELRHDGELELRTPVDGQAAADQLLVELRERLGIKPK